MVLSLSSTLITASLFLLSSHIAPVSADDCVVSKKPLIDQRFAYPAQIPFRADNDPTGRGPQAGYTQCNSTTEGQNSLCQLAIMNSLQDFCLWAPQTLSPIGDSEAATVAWCTQTGHGTRIIPQGTITGMQVLNTPDYILWAGTINQQNINIPADDQGGELDPRGCDLRGNPLGGLVYTNAWSNGNNNSYQQVVNWHNFMGTNQTCFKICKTTDDNVDPYCQNIYDEEGCGFVAPAAYQEGVFEVCDSDNMDPVGVYTSNGQVLTYTQGQANSVISIRTPSSSNCKTYSSSQLWSASVSVSGGASGSASGSAGASPTGSTGAKPSSAGGNKPSSAGANSPSGSSSPNAAMSTHAIGAGPFVAIIVTLAAGAMGVILGA